VKKCVVVSDSFKGSLSSGEIGRIACEVISGVFPECQIEAIPVADGGEGTVECFLACTCCVPVEITVSGPFGQPVKARYARQGETAVIEMAAAAGLPLAGEERNPAKATTYGVGEMIAHAAAHGCRRLLLGLGGSATNDGGCGCAAALGAVFRDKDGATFVPTGESLDRIHTIDLTALKEKLAGVEIDVMCDVTNPLYGPEGAAWVFAPQKGADRAMVEQLDHNLRLFAQTIERELGIQAAHIPGAGAAGGMGAGCVALLGGRLKRGIQAILDTVDFDGKLDGADLVITGEGRLDGQSLQGKVLSGVLERTRPRKIPVVAIVGDVDDSAYQAHDMGVSAIFSINRLAIPFEQAMKRSGEDYRRTLEDVMRLIRMAELF